jgi:hypothetical protein
MAATEIEHRVIQTVRDMHRGNSTEVREALSQDLSRC